MALKDVLGQENAINILRGCIARDRIPHALLFAGDEGIGKRLTAINFAKALNCQAVSGNDLFQNSDPQPLTPNPSFDSCDQCPSCAKIEKGNHPDVFIIAPEGEGGLIKVAVIRGLEEALSYKPFEGNYKIAVIDNADKMNQEAANAFLYTLEAPPSQSILILISSRPEMLLPTIRSRCQRINFTPLPVDTMSSLLRERFTGIDNAQALLLSILSGGRVGYALDEGLMEKRDSSFDMLKRMLDRFEEDVADEEISLEEWFEWSQIWLRDMAVSKATGRADLLVNRDKEAEIKAVAAAAPLRDLLKLARELYNIRSSLRFNLNEKLTLNYTGLLMRKRLGKE